MSRTSRGRAGYARGFVPAFPDAVVRLRGSRQARSRVVASKHVVCLRCGTGRQARGRAVVILPSLSQYAVTARRKARSARRRVVSAHAVALRVRGRDRADERGRAGLRSCVAPIVDPGISARCRKCLTSVCMRRIMLLRSVETKVDMNGRCYSLARGALLFLYYFLGGFHGNGFNSKFSLSSWRTRLVMYIGSGSCGFGFGVIFSLTCRPSRSL